MEKISKILPSSPRIKSVNHEESNKIRPGMPDFGVPVGKSSLGAVDKFSKSNAALNLGREFTSTDWKVRDMAKAGMVGQMTQNFFESRLEDDDDQVEVLAPIFRVPLELQEVEEPKTELVLEPVLYTEDAGLEPMESEALSLDLTA